LVLNDSYGLNIQGNLLEGDVLWDNNSIHRLLLFLLPILPPTTKIFRKVRENI
tara:strand:- start:3409 stop:3567 length:159 start_codon:yes stop_codon:yes gene_type:complete